jgi:hypothetical protein
MLGTLKAECPAICPCEREDKRVTKADLAAFLRLAWDLVWEEAVHERWDCCSLRGAVLGQGLNGEDE